MVNVAKRSKHIRNLQMCFLIEANRLMARYLISEAKRSKLLESCDSSKAKRTRAIVNKFIPKRSKHVDVKNLKKRSEAKWFIFKFDNIEVKRR